MDLDEAKTDLGVDVQFDDSTSDTRNLDVPLVEGKKHVDIGPSDVGVTGDEDAEESVERNDASETRDTTNRLLEGLGIGLATGEGIGLGAGERRRPPLVRFGSSVDRPVSSVVTEVMGDEGHGSV